MTPAEHESESKRLKIAITRAKSLLKKSLTLEEKLGAKRTITDLEERLRQHRLHYHILVDDMAENN